MRGNNNRKKRWNQEKYEGGIPDVNNKPRDNKYGSPKKEKT